MKTLKLLAFSALMLIFATALSLFSQMVEVNTNEDVQANIENYHTQPVDGVLVMNDALTYKVQ